MLRTSQKADRILTLLATYKGRKEGPCITDSEMEDCKRPGGSSVVNLFDHATTCHDCMVKVLSILQDGQTEGVDDIMRGILRDVEELCE